ncbi:MAG: RsbRD N-terminal domain-containing protein [Desulfobacteraceae bacterium]|jgi:hypothetical protein
MKLEKLLSEKGPAVLDRWLKLVLESYPADAQRFLKKQKDPFANPVRHTISKALENIYKALPEEVDRDTVSPFLDRVIRIRAVQDFSPSQAIAFVFLLKQVIREVLDKDIQEHHLSADLLALESRIDELALVAFDVYMGCREKIYALSANEARNQVYRLLQKKGLMAEIPEWEPRLKGSNNS